jgi:hypothetical protein
MMFWLLPVATALIVEQTASSRRNLLVGCASAASLTVHAEFASAAEGLSREAVEAKLSRVPLFVVTNSKDQPVSST